MNNYIDRLERELTRASQRPHVSPADRSTLPSRSTTLAAFGVVCGIALGALLAASGSSPAPAAALPVLGRPVVDAHHIRSTTARLSNLGARYSDSRRIQTPWGAGFVMPAEGGRFCLAVPDSVDGYGQACETLDQIEQHGLVVALTSQSQTRGEFVAVLPRAEGSVALRFADGRVDSVPVANGVAMGTVSEHATLEMRIGNVSTEIPLLPGCPSADAVVHPAAGAGSHFARVTCEGD